MRRLGRRVAFVERAVDPPPDRSFLAFARAPVAFGGADAANPEAEVAAVGLARGLEAGTRNDPCGPG